jgi:hypothetical protein
MRFEAIAFFYSVHRPNIKDPERYRLQALGLIQSQ